MKPRHLRLVPTSAPPGEPTPAERIRLAARRLGAIGREMAADAEALRGLTAPYSRKPLPVREAV